MAKDVSHLSTSFNNFILVQNDSNYYMNEGVDPSFQLPYLGHTAETIKFNFQSWGIK